MQYLLPQVNGGNVLASKRQQAIVEQVTQLGAVKSVDLAALLKVSEVTIRRDIETLANAGLIGKVHGGAVSLSAISNSEPAFATKSLRNLSAKYAIANLASKSVEPGDSIGLMGGSTVYEFAKKLLDTPNLTVVTNSVPVSDLFAHQGRPDQTAILTGGIRTPSNSLIGKLTISAFKSFNLKAIYFGAHGFDVDTGFTSPNFLEAETNSALLKLRCKRIVLVDSSKWKTNALATFGTLSDVDEIITDGGISRSALKTIKQVTDSVLVTKSVPAKN